MSHRNFSNILLLSDTGSIVSKSRNDASYIYVKNRGFFAWETGSYDGIYNFSSSISGSWKFLEDDIKVVSYTINSGSLLRFLSGSDYINYHFKQLIITNLSTQKEIIRWDVSDNDYESSYFNDDSISINAAGGLAMSDEYIDGGTSLYINFENKYTSSRNRVYISSSRATKLDVILQKNELPTDRKNTISVQSAMGKYVFLDNTKYSGFNTSSNNYNSAEGGFMFLSNGKSYNDVKRGELVLIKKDFNVTASIKSVDVPWGANNIYPEHRALKVLSAYRFQPSGSGSSKVIYNIAGGQFYANSTVETSIRLHAYQNITASFLLSTTKNLENSISTHLTDIDLNLNCGNVTQELDMWVTAYKAGFIQTGGRSGSYLDTYIAFGAVSPKIDNNEAPGIAPVKNAYGLYLEDMKSYAQFTGSGVTNAWGVYQLGRFTKNRFEGDVILHYLTGSGNRVLTVDNSGSISATTFSPDFANLTASNGLTNSAGTLELGGRLTKNTIINGTSSLYQLDIIDNSNKQIIFNIDTSDPNNIRSLWEYYQFTGSPFAQRKRGVLITSQSIQMYAVNSSFSLQGHGINIYEQGIEISGSGYAYTSVYIKNLSSSITTNDDFLVIDNDGFVSKTTMIPASKITGSFSTNTSIKTVNNHYTMSINDDILYVNTSGSNVIVLIPSTGTTKIQYIKKIHDNNIVILSGSDGALIEFENTASLVYRGEVARINRSGSNIYLL